MIGHLVPPTVTVQLTAATHANSSEPAAEVRNPIVGAVTSKPS